MPAPDEKPVAASPQPAATPSRGTPPSGPSVGDDRLSFGRLIGLDQRATEALLGAPLQRTESPPAMIWRYVSQDCELEIYFYLDLEAKIMRSLHYEVTSPEPDDHRCYEGLIRAHVRKDATSDP
jgi:hypothetical protein